MRRFLTNVQDCSSLCQGGEGNTNPLPLIVNPAKSWCFTFNNYKEKDLCSIISIFNSKADVGVIGREIGESGTPHLQGYVHFKVKLRPLSLGLSKKIHWELRRGTKQEACEYCVKEGNVAFCKDGRQTMFTLLNLHHGWKT